MGGSFERLQTDFFDFEGLLLDTCPGISWLSNIDNPRTPFEFIPNSAMPVEGFLDLKQSRPVVLSLIALLCAERPTPGTSPLGQEENFNKWLGNGISKNDVVRLSLAAKLIDRISCIDNRPQLKTEPILNDQDGQHFATVAGAILERINASEAQPNFGRIVTEEYQKCKATRQLLPRASSEELPIGLLAAEGALLPQFLLSNGKTLVLNHDGLAPVKLNTADIGSFICTQIEEAFRVFYGRWTASTYTEGLDQRRFQDDYPYFRDAITLGLMLNEYGGLHTEEQLRASFAGYEPVKDLLSLSHKNIAFADGIKIGYLLGRINRNDITYDDLNDLMVLCGTIKMDTLRRYGIHQLEVAGFDLDLGQTTIGYAMRNTFCAAFDIDFQDTGAGKIYYEEIRPAIDPKIDGFVKRLQEFEQTPQTQRQLAQIGVFEAIMRKTQNTAHTIEAVNKIAEVTNLTNDDIIRIYDFALTLSWAGNFIDDPTLKTKPSQYKPPRFIPVDVIEANPKFDPKPGIVKRVCMGRVNPGYYPFTFQDASELFSTEDPAMFDQMEHVQLEMMIDHLHRNIVSILNEI